MPAFTALYVACDAMARRQLPEEMFSTRRGQGQSAVARKKAAVNCKVAVNPTAIACAISAADTSRSAAMRGNTAALLISVTDAGGAMLARCSSR